MLRKLIERLFVRCKACGRKESPNKITKNVGRPYPDTFDGSRVEIEVEVVRHTCGKR